MSGRDLSPLIVVGDEVAVAVLAAGASGLAAGSGAPTGGVVVVELASSRVTGGVAAVLEDRRLVDPMALVDPSLTVRDATTDDNIKDSDNITNVNVVLVVVAVRRGCTTTDVKRCRLLQPVIQ